LTKIDYICFTINRSIRLLHEVLGFSVQVHDLRAVEEGPGEGKDSSHKVKVVPSLHLRIHGAPCLGGDSELIDGGSGPVGQSLSSGWDTAHRAGSEKYARRKHG